MTLDELKDYVIQAVERRFMSQEKKRIFFFKIARINDEKVWAEIVFWHPGEYILFAYRFMHEGVEESADGSIGPFTIISNHRSAWKRGFSFIDKIENGTKWRILKEEILNVKDIGSDEFGFYYYPKY